MGFKFNPFLGDLDKVTSSLEDLLAGTQYQHIEHNGTDWVAVDDITLPSDAFLYGGVASAGALHLGSTSHATKGDVNIDDVFQFHNDGGVWTYGDMLRIKASASNYVGIAFHDSTVDMNAPLVADPDGQFAADYNDDWGFGVGSIIMSTAPAARYPNAKFALVGNDYAFAAIFDPITGLFSIGDPNITAYAQLDPSGLTADRLFAFPDAAGTLALTSDIVSDHGALTGLTDDDHTQYLLAAGTRALTGNWAAGAFSITAKKLIGSNTTAMASHDTSLFSQQLTTTGNDIGSIYKGLNIDLDYTNAAGFFSTPTIVGSDLDIDLVNSGTGIFPSALVGHRSTISANFASGTGSSWAGQLANNSQALESLQSGIVGINQSVKDNSASAIFAAFTKSVNVGTGISHGYQGYGQNTSAGTGENAIGVYGFAASTSGLMVGLKGAPFTQGTRGFGLYSVGHAHLNAGNLYIYKNTALTAVAAKTHLTNASNQGALWVEGISEFDDWLYADGGIELADAKDLVMGTTTGTKLGTATSQKLGFWNTTPIVQPTTAIAAASFVANTSNIADDTATFDGYTIGQVVKALRNVGLLA